MAHILIDRVLLSHLRRANLRDGETALLVRDVTRGSSTAWRILDRAARTRIDVVDGVAVGAVEIAPGLGWLGGTVIDPRQTLPLTIVHAAMGMPASTLIEHPEIDPERPITPSAAIHGAFGVPIEEVALAIPRSPRTRLSHLLRIRRARLTATAIPKWVQTTFGGAAVMTAFSFSTTVGRVVHAGHPVGIDLGMAIVTGPCCLLFGLIALDAFTGRAISERMMRGRTSHEMLAQDAHTKWLREEFRRRGFDDLGRTA